MNGRTLTSLGLTAGVKVRVTGGQGTVELETVQDDAVADRALRISAALKAPWPWVAHSVKSAWSVPDGMA